MATNEKVKEYVKNLIILVELKFRLEEQVREYGKWKNVAIDRSRFVRQYCDRCREIADRFVSMKLLNKH